MTIAGLLPPKMQMLFWDLKYALGYGTGTLRETAAVIAEWAGERNLLDLGCGAGSFLRCLRAAGFTGHYTGVDLSAKAIERAKGSDNNSSWFVSGFAEFQSSERFSCICLIESIYYLNPLQAKQLLDRCAAMLTTDGRCYVRIHDANKHSRHVEVIAADPRHVQLSPNLFYVKH